ncbi:MFS transporter [Sutcliffiella horikoshii]|uniref:MFS transporter n=1 Tax=Sutcliffiella horikoshii TaxID=79883 RepID=A0A1Y0CK09_9BACI|nr:MULTISPECIES: MFS transporter [Bacillaceae]ART75628.1 MFS transporter [Sutcliffiella horikoshii]TYS73844.1 MFS transporter [Sutcliffiella horikoshii]
MKNMITIFKKPNYSLLFWSSFTSTMGSIVGIAALMLYLLDRYTDQPFYAALTELMYSLPTLAVFFLVGVLADRMDRQKIAVYSDVICAILSLALMGAIYIDWMPLVFAILFLRSAVSKFFHPAQAAIIQGILTKDEYTVAAGLNQMTSSLFMLFGNALGIFIYWTVGLQGAIFVCFVTYMVSAILIRACKLEENVVLPNGRHKWTQLNVRFVANDFKDGMLYIIKNPLLVYLIIGFFVFGIVNGGLSVMPAYILKYKLAPKDYEEFMIVMGVVFGISVLIGSIVASMMAKKLKLYQMVIIGLGVSGAFVVASGYSPDMYYYLAFTALIGLGLPFVNIGIGGWLPRIVDPKMMGRVQGWITPLMMLSQSITLGVIALTFQKILSVEGLHLLVGGCLLFVGLFYMFTLPKHATEEEEGADGLENSASV